MGTSASNGGPKGSPPLLPPWYNDDDTPMSPDPEVPGSNEPNDNSPSPEREPLNLPSNDQPNLSAVPEVPTKDLLSTNWNGAKGALTRISNNRGGSSYKKAGKKYVSSLGGARSATRAAVQGIRIGTRYASFLGNLSTSGFVDTLNRFGLSDLIGKSTEEICMAIANALAPIGTTNDEAIAREAMISTLDVLYSKIQENGNDISTLENLTPDLVKETLIEFVSNFVFTKWMYELGSSIEKGNITEHEAIDLEVAVKDLIYAETIEQYRDMQIEVNSLQDISTSKIIEEIFSTAYSLLEI